MPKLLKVKSIETLTKIAERFGKLALSETSPFANFDPTKFVSDWKQVIDAGRGCVILAVEDSSDLRAAGIICGVLENGAWHSKDILAREYIWWVTPLDRGNGIGESLLNAFTNWAKENGATHIVMASLKEFPQAEDFYQKQGFELIEKTWGKKIEGVNRNA